MAPIAAVRLKEDIEKMQDQLAKNQDNVATYRGAYLLISNRVDNAEGALDVYAKIWSIEFFSEQQNRNWG